MSLRRQRHSFSNPQRRFLQIESLEPRQMLSGNPVVIPIVSGTTYSFKDADNTPVRIKLTGAGSGQLTLTNGLATGGAIDTLTISGTTAKSQLVITASGGGDGYSTINSLVVGQNPGSGEILKQFTGSGINVSPGGLLQFYGSVGSIAIDDLGSGAAVNVTGGISKRFTANEFDANSSINVAGTLASLNVQTIDAGVDVVANQLTKITVGNSMTGANVNIGSGGINSAFFQNLISSNVWTSGNILTATIQASSTGSALAANRAPGSDNVFGTLDDFTINAANAANASIGPVTLNGAVGTGSNALQLISTGTVGAVTVPAMQPQPDVIDQAISQFIPLEIAQAVANATGYGDDDVWIAVFGQEIVTPGPGQVPGIGTTYFLDAANLNTAGASGQPTPIPISTATLNVGLNTPDLAILPSSTIAAWANASSPWGSNLQLPVPPPGNQYTGRIVISVGAPIQAQVVASNGTVAAPSASSSTDPSTGTFYDFLEFTVTNSASGVPSLDVDTSQVDAFGLPMTLQFFQDVLAQNPFNVNFTGNTATSSKTVNGLSSVAGLKVGQIVTGAGIPAGAIIDSVGTSSITLSVAASATATGVSLSALNGGPVGVDGTRNEILNGGNANSLLTFLNDQLTAGNEGARPFLQSAAPFETAGAIPINGATASGSLIVYTDSTVGLTNGDSVSISGVLGTTAANGVFTVSNVTANSFQLVGATSNGAYVSGGAWSMAITGASNPGAGPGNPIVITTSSTGNLQNGDLVEITGVQGNTNANGFFFVSNVTATTFTLVGSDGSGGTYTTGGTWRVFDSGPRLVSPKDVVEGLSSAASPNQLNNYFNEAIDDFFLQYLPATEQNAMGANGGGQTFSIVSNASGSNLTYTGTVKNLGTSFGYGLFLTTPTSQLPFVIFYPFTTANTPSGYTPQFTTVAPQPWLTTAGLEGHSASQMVFACDGYFADNTFRAAYYGLSTGWSTVLGDLEDSIASAFNRGIALEAPSTWGDRSTWFQQGNGQAGKYNYWVQYWHESGLAVNDLAYAFPYDDKYGSSTNLNVSQVGLARVLLNAWSNLQQPTTTTFLNFPTSAQQQGQITLTANAGPPLNPNPMEGTITFFIDGVAINSNDFSSSPPQQPIPVDGSGNATITATLPALSSGSTTHTYIVTAVYSGDQYTAPSIAYQPLKLVGVNGDFLMTVNPDQAALGASVNVSATLPGSTFNGAVALSIAHSDGTGSQALSTTNVTSSNWNANVTIPTNLLTFTGDVTLHSNLIQNVSSVVDLVEGQTITNANFTGAPTITAITPPSLNLSQAALKTGTVTFLSNGVQFTATAIENQTTLTGLNSLAGLAANVAITQVTGNSELLQPGTTVVSLVQGSVQVNGNAQQAATGVTITSNGAGAIFPVTAVFTPTSGGPFTANMGFQGPVLP